VANIAVRKSMDQLDRSSAPRARMLPHGLLIPFILVIGLFFLWGVPNNLNDVLIRQFMKSFALSRFQAGLVQSAFYFGYFVLATPAALLMRRFGYKSGFVVGLLLFERARFSFGPLHSSVSINTSWRRCLSLPVAYHFLRPPQIRLWRSWGRRKQLHSV